MSPEERSKFDAAAAKFLGEVEAKVAEFRNYLGMEWNKNPDIFELTSKAYNLRFDIDLAYTELELEL